MTIRDGGLNASRKILAGQDDLSDVAAGHRSNVPIPYFQIAVVDDVIYNPVALTKEEKDLLSKKVTNPELIDRIPRNSVIATTITREINKSNSVSRIFFPLNVYDAQPIKPGEHVLIFFLDPHRTTQIGFWICRVAEPLDTDDMCFTHSDRKFEFTEGLSTFEKFQGGTLKPPGFPNGGNDTEDALTLSEQDGYEKINKEAKANSVVVKEPVARFSKRPGDRAIFGSNNTRIVLGMDRTGSSSETPEQDTGTIDIVATSYELPATDLSDPAGSSPRTITNSRNERETDKHPQKRNKTDNVAEGDPDFVADSSRMYISANTNADENFELEIDGIPQSGEGPAIVLKSTQLRLVARNDIKIMTEGGASIVLSGPNIYFTPGASGIVYLGGADANLAVAGNTGAAGGGTAAGVPVIDTMGGQQFLGNDTTGFFSTKVLMK